MDLIDTSKAVTDRNDDCRCEHALMKQSRRVAGGRSHAHLSYRSPTRDQLQKPPVTRLEELVGKFGRQRRVIVGHFATSLLTRTFQSCPSAPRFETIALPAHPRCAQHPGIPPSSCERSVIPAIVLAISLCCASAALAAAPNPPSLVTPAADATGTSTSPLLQVAVSDPDQDAVTVTWFGRLVPAAGPDFTLIGLPDTQYYTSAMNGGSNAIFKAQTQWIVAQRAARNIVDVVHLGDCTQNGDNGGNPIEWQRADTAMRAIENPATGLPAGIPYGICVGNHDQTPEGDASGPTTLYNQYFGVSRFASRSYYGGHYGSKNENPLSLLQRERSRLHRPVPRIRHDARRGGSRLGGQRARRVPQPARDRREPLHHQCREIPAASARRPGDLRRSERQAQLVPHAVRPRHDAGGTAPGRLPGPHGLQRAV
jgi:hypothetical protein